MYKSVTSGTDPLRTYLDTSSSISTKSLVLGEWNLNIADNINTIGNYYYNAATPLSLTNTFVEETSATVNPKYFGSTDSIVSLVDGYDADNNAQSFTSQNLRNKMLFSLEDCFTRFRPRSGINKLVYFSSNEFVKDMNQGNITKSPRFYPADRSDKFKYWTSYRNTFDSTTNTSSETGISLSNKSINDTVPFVVYKNSVPSNRIVIKTQTKVRYTSNDNPSDYFAPSKKVVPTDWNIQYLDSSNTWNDLDLSDPTILLDTDTFSTNGYLELAYGISNLETEIASLSPTLDIRKAYFAGEYTDSDILPTTSIDGHLYLITGGTNVGKYAVWNGGISGSYSYFTPEYKWYVKAEGDDKPTNYLSDLVSPPLVVGSTTQYQSLQYIKGLRLIVNELSQADNTFDLIELSPRLAVDLTEKTSAFNVKKSASDLGISGLPVGQLLASTGSLTLFDYDLAFALQNENSVLNIKDSDSQIVSSLSSLNLQVKIYDVIYDASNNAYTVPIKTMYAENIPEISLMDRTLTISLRDLYFYFESITAPEMLVTNQYFSYIVALLLDAIGFTNYDFKLTSSDLDTVIPYFFVGPNTSVAQVLGDLAVSTQTAVFLDENNNLVFMSKNYIMPSSTDRSVDLELRGSIDAQKNGINENEPISANLANIISLSSQQNQMYNDGKINYVSRYIQRSTGTLAEQSLVDVDRSWIYKPVLLWEISPDKNTKSINDEISNQSTYSLSAMALNSDRSSDLPSVSGGQVINNTLDFGESIYWISRYSGYFHANGEIIRYDAVEYSVAGTGNVWITSVEEYQKYFASISFNGKMYPTGKVRIYAEPYYDETTGLIKDGAVAKHGRGQFGTNVVTHLAGLSSDNYWLNESTAKVCKFDPDKKNVFDGGVSSGIKDTDGTVTAGVVTTKSAQPLRTGFIKNNLSSIYRNETEINTQRSIQTGTVQSSALTLSGSPSFTDNPHDYISYVYKEMSADKKYFGSRMRIVGETSSDIKTRFQYPRGTTSYYTVNGKNIGGSGGGLGVLVNPKTNMGYYFEIVALTDISVDAYGTTDTTLYNVFFYKLEKSADSSLAVPIVLYKGTAPIIVNDGTFAGQSRVYAEKNTSVYDLAVEYEKTSFGLRFHLYINDKYVTSIDDKSPLKLFNHVALFVRGTSKMMFENIYALKQKEEDSTESLASNDSLNRYSLNSAMKSSYLKNINSQYAMSPEMYYDEFGTIMREMAYFNIKYDKAYPALTAKIAPTFNKIQGYTVAGFSSTPYGAEFLLFNTTDTVLNLDETSGNYLRILGVTFTQQSEHQLMVDDYLSKVGDYYNLDTQTTTNRTVINNRVSSDIKLNRLTYGKKEFSINAPYIQTVDSANSLMSWLLSKVTVPKKSVGVEILADPTIQLGDLVTIDYTSKDGLVAFSSTPGDAEYARFIVYSIDYSKSVNGPSMTVYLSEVI